MAEDAPHPCPNCGTPMEARDYHWFCSCCYRREHMSWEVIAERQEAQRREEAACKEAWQKEQKMLPLLLGLDLGQVSDPSALAVAEQERREEDDLREYRVRHLQRWPLGTPYPQIVDDVGNLLVKLPGHRFGKQVLILDGTGAGRPVVDMIRREGLPGRLVPVYIHGGAATNPAQGGGWNVGKRTLASTVQSCLQSRRLHIAAGLAEANNLVRELQTFTAKINIATGAESFEAWRERDKDDLVLAVAMLCWYGEFGQRRLWVAT